MPQKPGGKELRAGDESATALNADISYLSPQVSLPVCRLWGCRPGHVQMTSTVRGKPGDLFYLQRKMRFVNEPRVAARDERPPARVTPGGEDQAAAGATPDPMEA